MKFNKRFPCCLILLLFFPAFSRPGFNDGQEGAAPDRQKIEAELFTAAEKGDFETIKSLLTKYPDMKDVKQNGGWTLLHMALNSREIVEYLIDIGADIEARTDGQWTPLHSQAYYGHKDGVELLLEHGADIEAKHAYDMTPLLNSVRFNRVEAAKALVEKGAKVDSPDTMGRTALILSATKGYSELAKIILESGADIRIKDKSSKRSALHFAALNGHLEIVAEILKKGADVNEKDGAGKTPLDYANQYGHEKVAKLLKSSGAEGEIDTRNFGSSPYLKKALQEGEACVWYMGRAGYAVKTKNHLLLFSYFVEGNPPDEPRLANGHVDLDEIADYDTIVFAGGSQYWHHNPERYGQWQKAHKSISFLYSFEDKPGRNPLYLKDVEGPAFVYLPDGGKTTIKGVKVETIPVLGLGPRGSGFLVEADGVAVFFGGDHVLLSESQREKYRKTIDDLKNTGKAIDLLILPATIAMDRATPISVEGVDYAIETLQPKAYLASDGESTEFVLSEVTAALAKDKRQTKVFCPEHRGDMFILKAQSAAELVRKAIEEKGLVTAKEEFAKILQDKDRAAFDESEFLALGNEYLKAGKPHLAAAVFAVATEAFPGSVSVLRLLAHSFYLSGDEEKSLKVQGKMMSVRAKAELADFLEKNKNPLAETAEDVIARSLEATGGRKAWEAIKTMVVVFSSQSTAGEQTRMVRMYKRPFFYRQGLEGSPDFIATDGTTCWNVIGGEWKKEASNFYLPLVSMDNWFLDYEVAGIRYEFMGYDHLNGSPVYHLRRTFRDGFVEDLYFSAITNLLTEVRSDYVQRQPFMKSFKSLWNYRDVDGVKIPFVFMRNMGPLEPPHGGVNEKVRVNVPLDDRLFLPPDYKQ